MRRGLGRSGRLKALMMVSHHGARCQMGSERIHEGSPSFKIKQRISIIQLVPTRRTERLAGSGRNGKAGKGTMFLMAALCLKAPREEGGKAGNSLARRWTRLSSQHSETSLNCSVKLCLRKKNQGCGG